MLLVSMFFFKQKAAYEVRISDWSSDVCSSVLVLLGALFSLLLSPWLTGTVFVAVRAHTVPGFTALLVGGLKEYGRFFRLLLWALLPMGIEIGRASCRARVCRYV